MVDVDVSVCDVHGGTRRYVEGWFARSEPEPRHGLNLAVLRLTDCDLSLHDGSYAGFVLRSDGVAYRALILVTEEWDTPTPAPVLAVSVHLLDLVDWPGGENAFVEILEPALAPTALASTVPGEGAGSSQTLVDRVRCGQVLEGTSSVLALYA